MWPLSETSIYIEALLKCSVSIIRSDWSCGGKSAELLYHDLLCSPMGD